MRRLHDLWNRGQAAAVAPRHKVVMALGDSISESAAYITVRQLDCALPDFDFDYGYRLIGQPGYWSAVQTSMSGQKADWGLSVLQTTGWYSQIRPEVATVLFGTNELWHWHLGLQQYVDNMRMIVDELLTHNVIPILLTVPPGSYTVADQREICGQWCDSLATNYQTEDFAAAVRQLAAERQLPLVDLHRRFVDFDRPGWAELLSDGVHPCYGDCWVPVNPTGTELRDDSVLRMYKFLEAKVMGRCPGATAPAEPVGYQWNDTDVLANFSASPPTPYCPDPVAQCE